MRIITESVINEFDIGIYGLGYESRAITTFCNEAKICKNNIVVGYRTRSDNKYYVVNKEKYETYSKDRKILCDFIEEDDPILLTDLTAKVKQIIEKGHTGKNIKCLLDITVMSRHRLTSIIVMLLDNLPKKSILIISYQNAIYSEPVDGPIIINYIGEINARLRGDFCASALPAMLIIGLGYEKDKALSCFSFVDADYNYLLIPKAIHDEAFNKKVKENNLNLIDEIDQSQMISYEVKHPNITYLRLRELIMYFKDSRRQILIPLGPKILAAICSIIGFEFPEISIWRASSDHNEKPVDKEASGDKVQMIIEV